MDINHAGETGGEVGENGEDVMTHNSKINMTRREILEKNWKDFRLSTGLEYEPMSDKAYEFMENAMEEYAELRLGAVGLPIHATNEDNTYTFCGLKVNKSMSYHRGGIMLGMIIGRENACKECLSHCH